MTPTRLEDVAIRVAAALGEDECVLIGGLAVGAHGYVRATTDVDFIVRDLEKARQHLRENGLAVERGRGAFPCLKGTIDGIRFDILPPLVPIQWDRAKIVSLGKSRIRVVDLEGLVRLKLKAGGPQDLMDVAALVLRHPEQQARAEELAVAYQIRDKLDIWLRDPRLKAQLAEETTARGPARPRRTKAKSKPKTSR